MFRFQAGYDFVIVHAEAMGAVDVIENSGNEKFRLYHRGIGVGVTEFRTKNADDLCRRVHSPEWFLPGACGSGGKFSAPKTVGDYGNRTFSILFLSSIKLRPMAVLMPNMRKKFGETGGSIHLAPARLIP